MVSALQFNGVGVAAVVAGGMGEEGTADGGDFGDAYGDVDGSGANVGKRLKMDVTLECGGKLVFLGAEVVKVGGAVFSDTEQCAVAEGISPGSEFVEVFDEIVENGVGNEAGLIEEFVEFVGK